MRSKHKLYKLRYVQVPWYVAAAAVTAVVAFFLVINHNLDKDIANLKGIVADGNYALSMKQKEVSELAQKVQLASTDDFIANEARTKHGFLAEGEIRFVVTNPEVLYGTEGAP